MYFTGSNAQTATRYTLVAVTYCSVESLYIKTTLDYQKVENFMSQNTFMNAARETLKYPNIYSK